MDPELKKRNERRRRLDALNDKLNEIRVNELDLTGRENDAYLRVRGCGYLHPTDADLGLLEEKLKKLGFVADEV